MPYLNPSELPHNRPYWHVLRCEVLTCSSLSWAEAAWRSVWSLVLYSCSWELYFCACWCSSVAFVSCKPCKVPSENIQRYKSPWRGVMKGSLSHSKN